MHNTMQRLATMTRNTRFAGIAVVYLSALLQGIALILFPAAGALFTSPEFHNLSDGQFGVLFTPQIIGAIAASMFASRLVRRFSMQRVFQLGLLANLLAMLLLATSHLVIGTGLPVFLLLLAGTAAVGAGFGLTLTVLNAYAFDLFRNHADAAVTTLHVLTGSGQAAAPLLLATFRDAGLWWGAPLVVLVALALMLGIQAPLALRLSMEGSPLPATSVANKPCAPPDNRLPPRIWIFGLVVFFYGASEATFGNWSTIYLEDNAGLDPALAAQGLALFWGAVALGRVLFALATIWLRPQVLYPLAPLLIAASFIVLPLVQGTTASLLVLAVAGLAMSFFFPLSISMASAEEPDMVDAVSGTMVAGIQLGIGASALLVGQLTNVLALPTIFQFSSVYGLLMAALVLYLVLTRPSPQKEAQ